MALIIKGNNSFFSVEGSINTSTALRFQSHFEMLLNKLGELTIDIENASEIDREGIGAIKVLFDMAKLQSKRFYIVGVGCKEIYDELRFLNAAA